MVVVGLDEVNRIVQEALFLIMVRLTGSFFLLTKQLKL